MEQLCRTIKTERNGWKAMYLCDCGEEFEALEYNVRIGCTKSCGCLRRRRTGSMNYKHGMTYSPTWSSWQKMIQRCDDPNNNRYHRYGERGITYDLKWATFEGFYEDMGDSPGTGWSLDKIDNDGNYCKDNCQWLTKSDNSSKRWKDSRHG